MLNYSAAVHDLFKQDGISTKVEIYFIDDAVDCTDDAAVKASTSVIRSSDIEMNGGLKWTEQYNKGEDTEVGETVSSMFSASIENGNGRFTNFSFGRCKVYASILDGSDWVSVPMGVYVMDTPIKRRVSPITATAYDQMVYFEKDASDWWDTLDFTNGLTLSDILTSLATYCGVKVKNASSITNGTYSYSEKPFDASEMTCRDVLAWIAGAAAGNARFDRNGYLEIKQFSQVSYEISIVTSPSVCLEYDVAEYSTPLITRLQVAQSDSDIGAIIGNDDTTTYRMLGNGFMRGDSVASVLERATPIYNVLVSYGIYSPMQIKTLADITVESGDIIIFDGMWLPIFQQTFEWHGGRFYANILSTGSAIRPKMPYTARMNYKEQKEFYVSLSEKVGDSEIIAKINLSPEEAKIIANKISLIGYVTVNNGFAIDTDGKMTANGATINGDFESTAVDENGNTWSITVQNGIMRILRNGVVMQSLTRNANDDTISTHTMNDDSGMRRVLLSSIGDFWLYDDNGSPNFGINRSSAGNNVRVYDSTSADKTLIWLNGDDTEGHIQLYDINGNMGTTIASGYGMLYDNNGNLVCRLNANATYPLEINGLGVKQLLGYRGAASSVSTDFNDITTSGIYYVDGTTMKNGPTYYTWGYLMVLGFGTLKLQVLFRGNATGLVQLREYSGSPQTWGAWRTA